MGGYFSPFRTPGRVVLAAEPEADLAPIDQGAGLGFRGHGATSSFEMPGDRSRRLGVPPWIAAPIEEAARQVGRVRVGAFGPSIAPDDEQQQHPTLAAPSGYPPSPERVPAAAADRLKGFVEEQKRNVAQWADETAAAGADVADTQADVDAARAVSARGQEAGDAAARARILSGGLQSHFKESTVDPWNPNNEPLSFAQIESDLHARGALAARHQQRLDEITERALRDDPMRKKIEAESLNRAYEEILPYDPRPLLSGATMDEEGKPVYHQGAFTKLDDGTYVNAPPAPRLGDMRRIQQGAIAARATEAAFDSLRQTRENLAAEVEAGRMDPQEHKQAADAALRETVLRLLSIYGGKGDFGDVLPKPDPFGDLDQDAKDKLSGGSTNHTSRAPGPRR